MSISAFVGILIATSGVYLALTRMTFSHQPSSRVENSAIPISPRFSIPHTAVYQTLVFVGLAMLGISHAATGELATASAFAGGVRSSVFYLGAGLALAGAIGVVFASKGKTVALSAAILGTGSATVLGVSGNAVAGGFLLAGAALCGWWLHHQSQRSVGATLTDLDESHDNSVIEHALSDGQQSIPEPLLTSITVVMFCWILGATLQSAIVEGTDAKSAMSGSVRALPRPAFNVETRQTESSRDDLLFWCAAGLLAAAAGLSGSRSGGDCNFPCPADSAETSQQPIGKT